MMIRESVVVFAAAEKVWRWVLAVERSPEWNPKVRSVSRISRGRLSPGYRYRLLFLMSGRETEMEAEIQVLQPMRRLQVVHRELNSARGDTPRQHVEIFELEPVNGHTRVVHTVKMTMTGVNPVIRLLMWLLMRFGKETEVSYLHRFRDLVEADGEK